MKTIARILIIAVALMGVSSWVPGITVDSFYIALIASVVFALINVTLKPLLVLLTFPINLITLGLFTFVINGALFYFVASFVDGFDVDGFAPAFLGALIMSLVSYLSHKFLNAVDSD